VRAADLFRRACDGGHAYGCTSLGNWYFEGDGQVNDPEVATEMWFHSCEMEQDGNYPFATTGEGCFRFGEMMLNGATATAENLELSCNLGHMRSCSAVGMRYKEGWGVDKDLHKAMQFWERACRWGDREGCIYLSEVQ
ncbi:MAG: sel1 repeat family protein, partial [Proteobacteria bacterium]|nr:sel1 repeat family protein [Pseudomonadota bacterium]